MNVSVFHVLAVVNEIDLFKSWVPYLKVSNCISGLLTVSIELFLTGKLLVNLTFNHLNYFLVIQAIIQ